MTRVIVTSSENVLGSIMPRQITDVINLMTGFSLDPSKISSGAACLNFDVEPAEERFGTQVCESGQQEDFALTTSPGPGPDCSVR